jgi:hypothetical protein
VVVPYIVVKVREEHTLIKSHTTFFGILRSRQKHAYLDQDKFQICIKPLVKRPEGTCSPPDSTVLGVTFYVESDGEVSGGHMLREGVHFGHFMSASTAFLSLRGHSGGPRIGAIAHLGLKSPRGCLL